ncbi:ankyrin repeat-containing domain protein [Staphylotrichum tortipilum]|uniref:Ankyrin repeat-containing domain protein n=1 Tax=Staphylotrichum tortipilum TaxID=2831512 RepID=A0AAN6MI58_9PEZI|nr:ankyrin repeat-containing domain protein [Staphylotrichum longicolle]
MAAPSHHLLMALPLELLVFVIEDLDRVEDIAALALTNRRLYSAANPLLYQRAAQCRDGRPLAWAANHGLVATLKMALGAGIDPNFEFVERVPADEWERVTAQARADAAAARPKKPWAMWDWHFNDQPRADARWRVVEEQEPEEAQVVEVDDETGHHAPTPATISTAAPSPHPQLGSDLESVLSSEDDLSHRSDATPATEPSPTPTPTPPDTVVRRYHAIHLAARGGHDEVAELLLRHGADVNASSERFCACTPLYGLLNALENPDPAADRPTWLPLHVAICHSHPATAQLLLAHNASIFMEAAAPDDNHSSSSSDHYTGSTALHHASALGLTTLVTHLLDIHPQKTDINAPDPNTLTPFYHAYAYRRWSSTIPLLLARGADMECETKMYIPYTAITPLGEACRLGDFAVADRLIDLGADVTNGFIALTSGGCLTPLHMCCMRSAQPAGEPPEKGADDEARGRARMKTMEKLLRGGAKLDARDCFGSTPLMAAVQACNTFALEALSIAGADVEEEDPKAPLGGKAKGDKKLYSATNPPSPPSPPLHHQDE